MDHEAYTEKVEVKTPVWGSRYVCNHCGRTDDYYGGNEQAFAEHCMTYQASSYSEDYIDHYDISYEYVDHPEEGHYEWLPTGGYYCTICGATK